MRRRTPPPLRMSPPPPPVDQRRSLPRYSTYPSPVRSYSRSPPSPKRAVSTSPPPAVSPRKRSMSLDSLSSPVRPAAAIAPKPSKDGKERRKKSAVQPPLPPPPQENPALYDAFRGRLSQSLSRSRSPPARKSAAKLVAVEHGRSPPPRYMAPRTPSPGSIKMEDLAVSPPGGAQQHRQQEYYKQQRHQTPVAGGRVDRGGMYVPGPSHVAEHSRPPPVGPAAPTGWLYPQSDQDRDNKVLNTAGQSAPSLKRREKSRGVGHPAEKAPRLSTPELNERLRLEKQRQLESSIRQQQKHPSTDPYR